MKELEYPLLRQLLTQWRQISPDYYGDFYPLTPWSRDHTAWIAWQFDRPDPGEGCVQVFRRDQSFYEAARLKLHALEPEVKYTVVALTDGGASHEYVGRELMETGLPVNLGVEPAAAVLTYRKISPQ